jgi:hypothetical protein
MSRRRVWFPFGGTAGTTEIIGTPTNLNLGATFAVPVGVTAGMTAVIVMATASATAVDSTLTAAGATFTKQEERSAGNMRVSVFTGTGLVAGQLITTGGSSAANSHVTHMYTDKWRVVDASLVSAIRGGSSASTTSGSVSPAAGGGVLLVAAERTIAAPTTVSSVVSSGGETVTQSTFDEDATTATTIYLGTFTASDAAARTATITYSDASGNGYAALALLSSSSGSRRLYAAAVS